MKHPASDKVLTAEFKEVMINKAIENRKLAYCPYSKFQVGACILGKNGKFYTGANVENQSYGLTVCAERTAVFNMILDGCHEINAVAVATGIGASPCGACRQVLAEFVGQGDFPVLIVNSENRQTTETTMAGLLPFSLSIQSELQKLQHEK